jgi:hypothetical protein
LCKEQFYFSIQFWIAFQKKKDENLLDPTFPAPFSNISFQKGKKAKKKKRYWNNFLDKIWTIFPWHQKFWLWYLLTETKRFIKIFLLFFGKIMSYSAILLFPIHRKLLFLRPKSKQSMLNLGRKGVMMMMKAVWAIRSLYSIIIIDCYTWKKFTLPFFPNPNFSFFLSFEK